ncbi:hypothetical protein HRI_004422000 [Hibiscus trionum]|uniref:Uncharacterized protein n=1 Tax=Hibiscus trionum TaxID=183268 RepID=A0A9W7J713_HIBTR|nr:hypothetical protein HRI_004422000 [Hibiscus trionum]
MGYVKTQNSTPFFLSSFKQKGRSGLSLIFHTLKQLLTPTTTINSDLFLSSPFTSRPLSVTLQGLLDVGLNCLKTLLGGFK